MRTRRPSGPPPVPLPETLHELHDWIQQHVTSPTEVRALAGAIDHVFVRHERLWHQSKQDALQAMSAGFAERMRQLRDELAAREATVASITQYFEELVAELTDRVHRDPKTRLMNFRRFIEQLEGFLAIEQRGRWCAVGLADITSFKSINDEFGHAVGDRIIERVARLLREQIRSNDLMAQESAHGQEGHELHARFGGDEFCFLIPDLDHAHDAWVIADRFRDSVDRFRWALEDERLAGAHVGVDVGVVCLLLGPVGDRRPIARQLANDLLSRADKSMYEAKMGRSRRVHPVQVRVEAGVLIDVGPDGLPDPVGEGAL
jgi:diguanylate cyclase (GGDEF)-like protein